MNTPQAILISGSIITGAILIQNIWPKAEESILTDTTGRYMVVGTSAIIRVNIIDTQTGAVRHCWTDDNGNDFAKCSEWVGAE